MFEKCKLCGKLIKRIGDKKPHEARFARKSGLETVNLCKNCFDEKKASIGEEQAPCKLKDIVHKEMFCGVYEEEEFNFHSNRFELFDKGGNEIFLKESEDAFNYDVLETKRSGYSGYGVGFPVTHIRLDCGSDKRTPSTWSIKFGEWDTRP